MAHSANTELQTTKADLEQAKAKIKVLKRKLDYRNKAATKNTCCKVKNVTAEKVQIQQS